MIVLTVEYTIRPEDGPEILSDLAEMTRLVKAHEPGATAYRVHVSRDQDDKILLYEAYVDDVAWQAHNESPYFQEIVLGRIVPKLVERRRSFWTLASDDGSRG